jgi:hypothetical protein
MLAVLHRFPLQGMVCTHHHRYPHEVRVFHPQLSSTLTAQVSSLTWCCLIPLSTNAGQMALLCTGPGILCALASVFASLMYARNRHLLERVMQDKVSVIHFNFGPSHSSIPLIRRESGRDRPSFQPLEFSLTAVLVLCMVPPSSRACALSLPLHA